MNNQRMKRSTKQWALCEVLPNEHRLVVATGSSKVIGKHQTKLVKANPSKTYELWKNNNYRVGEDLVPFAVREKWSMARMERYAKQFLAMFNRPLRDFWHPIFGFEAVSFNAQVVNRDKEAANLIKRLLTPIRGYTD
jgi:hypothetical protein